MKIPMRSILAPLAIALTYGGFAFSCPQLTEEYCLDVWNYGQFEREIEQREAELAVLNGKTPRSLERHALQMIVVHDLIDGRMKLAEASDQFYSLDVMDPEIISHTRRQYPAEHERESVALQTMAFVKAALRSDPARCGEIVHRLEGELALIRTEEATADH